MDSSKTSTENKVGAGNPEVFEVDQQNKKRSDQSRRLAIAQHVNENASRTENLTKKP